MVFAAGFSGGAGKRYAVIFCVYGAFLRAGKGAIAALNLAML
jgi:hypothetical protein